ncbi:MAG: hypothetical protein J6W96_00955 [Alphaproteobacteria bacterium]|nr:hypothetical protein [Alphaproteobacteria bacterium]
MPTVIKPEEILPENFNELQEKCPSIHTVIILQAIGAILISKNIMKAEELNETAKELYKIQRDKMIEEFKNAKL